MAEIASARCRAPPRPSAAWTLRQRRSLEVLQAQRGETERMTQELNEDFSRQIETIRHQDQEQHGQTLQQQEALLQIQQWQREHARLRTEQQSRVDKVSC